tara:strand:+ start:183 stop:425 length:243 start_codon:yes stop_codon:yes gene_type:complete
LSEIKSSFFNLPIDRSDYDLYNIFHIKENNMKNEKAKKVHKTKATLVAELEVAMRLDKGFLNSLERANAQTIKRLIEQVS